MAGLSVALWTLTHPWGTVAGPAVGRISRAAATVTVLGAALLIPPPPPLSRVPWVLFPVGGLLLGIGIAALGPVVRAEARRAQDPVRVAA